MAWLIYSCYPFCAHWGGGGDSEELSLSKSVELPINTTNKGGNNHSNEIYGLVNDKYNIYIPSKNDSLIIYKLSNRSITIKRFPENKRKCEPDLANYYNEIIYMSCRNSVSVFTYDIPNKEFSEINLEGTFSKKEFLIADIMLDAQNLRMYFINLYSPKSFFINLNNLKIETINFRYPGCYNAGYVDVQHLLISCGASVALYDLTISKSIDSIDFQGAYKIEQKKSKFFVSSSTQNKILEVTVKNKQIYAKSYSIDNGLDVSMYVNSLQITDKSIYAFSRYPAQINIINYKQSKYKEFRFTRIPNANFTRSLLLKHNKQTHIFVIDQKNNYLYDYELKDTSSIFRLPNRYNPLS